MPKSKYRKAKPGGHCHYCGGTMSSPQLNLPDSATVEHIVPKSMGGNRTLSNIVVVCKSCNGKRGNGPSPCGCRKCKMAWYMHFLRQSLIITDARPGSEVYHSSFMEVS